MAFDRRRRNGGERRNEDSRRRESNGRGGRGFGKKGGSFSGKGRKDNDKPLDECEKQRVRSKPFGMRCNRAG